MEYKNNLMSQLVFKFPFKTKYYEQDFYVSSNNFSAYKLLESWPRWPGKWLNVYGASGSGKTHLSKILENYQNNIDEKLFYSILNQSKQLDNYIVINSVSPISEFNFNLKDLQSRLNSFIFIGIELPTDDLLQVIISKSFSDKQINLKPKISEYIIKNVERSYEKMFKFLRDIDELSLSTGKSININLIKKVLNK